MLYSNWNFLIATIKIQDWQAIWWSNYNIKFWLSLLTLIRDFIQMWIHSGGLELYWRALHALIYTVETIACQCTLLTGLEVLCNPQTELFQKKSFIFLFFLMGTLQNFERSWVLLIDLSWVFLKILWKNCPSEYAGLLQMGIVLLGKTLVVNLYVAVWQAFKLKH